MFIDRFLGKRPSHFEINPIVKAFIISESFLWSAWDFIMPIIAIFIAKNVASGSIQMAATGYSFFLVSRVISELIAGRILFKTSDRKKMLIAIFGIVCISVAYFSFSQTTALILVFLSYCILGIGFGVASPAKNALFAIHLDKNRESTEWSLNDAICATAMALATALGGFVAAEYGFQTLFLIAGFINIISILPYLLYVYPSLDFWK